MKATQIQINFTRVPRPAETSQKLDKGPYLSLVLTLIIHTFVHRVLRYAFITHAFLHLHPWLGSHYTCMHFSTIMFWDNISLP